jgi:sugar phosphate isomerase/epimerase
MLSAITICLVPEARQGPFVFHGETALAEGCRVAAELGFDAVEIFPSSAAQLRGGNVAGLLNAHGLRLAAVGTGAGWVKHQLHLVAPEPTGRAAAQQFIADIIDAAGELGAPAIIGSMQGRWGGEVSRESAEDLLADALAELEQRAASHAQVLLYEPLNRYETNLFNRQADAAAFLRRRGLQDVRLLCDLFHMNIEEPDIGKSLRDCGALVGHVHWADSNRQAVGLGHTPMEPVIAALQAIGYDGMLSAEIFPLPTAAAAARQSRKSMRSHTTA